MTSRTISIVEWSPQWHQDFQHHAQLIRAALGSLALRIDHIGSTSVPGLDAKDVVDMQVTVAHLDPVQLAGALAPLGFELRRDITSDHVPVGENPDSAEWAKLYFRPPSSWRPINVHVRRVGRANQQYALLFRDYLRAHPGAAGSYALIKRELAHRHADDIDAYYAIKDPVCDLIMDAARLWAAATAWQPGPSDA